MILIFSQNNEFTTQLVINWLVYYKKDWFRINEDDRIEIENITIEDGQREPKIVIRVNNHRIDFNEVTSYWYRRGGLTIYPRFHSSTKNNIVDYHINKHILEEIESLSSFVFWYLKTYKHSLGDFYDASNRKLHYLTLARQAGLMIPPTRITGDLCELMKFRKDQQRLVTKSIHEILSFEFSDQKVFSYTNPVLIDDIRQIGVNNFFPSLFQMHVDKKIELRIFFVHEELYTMAIFSQENEKTKIDFRNYDMERPNRSVPFQLPDDIINKIRQFIQLSQLDTGSIDMLLNNNNDFLFLEVNSVGQFGMTSEPCNYFLEERVAKYLSDGIN